MLRVESSMLKEARSNGAPGFRLMNTHLEEVLGVNASDNTAKIGNNQSQIVLS